MGWQKKRHTNNREVCRLELINYLIEKEFNVDSFDFNASWESQIIKLKDSDYHKLIFFERDLVKYF